MSANELPGVVGAGFLETLRSINSLLFAQVDSEERLFDVVTEAFVSLGLRGGVMLQTGTQGTLTVRQAVTHPFIQQVEKLVGLKTIGHRVDAVGIDVYRSVLAGETVFLSNTRALLEQLLPSIARPFAGLIHKTVGQGPGVYAPLRSCDRVVGILNATGPALTRGDVPAMEALASGVALGLDRIRLRRIGLAAGEGAATSVKSDPSAAAVRALEEQRAALNHHAIVSITDTRGRITSASDRFCALSGYSRDELVGQTHAIVNSGVHPPEFFRQMWETIAAGRVWQGELCNRARDGRRVWLAATIVPLLDEAGRPREYIAFRTDITGQKETEEQLRRARDAADAANRAKDTFLANTSHELRTPMNAIIGMTRLALDLSPSGELRENLDLVLDAANGLMVTLNDILDFSKIEAGRLRLDIRPFELAEEIDRTLRTFSHLAKTRDLALSWTIDSSVSGFAAGDPHRLRQIINNLVGNALKFTERGRVTVKVTREREHVVLTVADTGVGIPADKLDRVFMAFEQADVSVTRRHGGTGLGLSISRTLSALMGGEVQLTSQEGVGTTVTARLQLPPAVAPISSASGPTPLAPVRALRVLVAEDNVVNQRLVQRLLEGWGHRVELVANGRAAVTRAVEERFDLILMDLNMPGMGGLEATRLIRDGEHAAGLTHTPIIAITANAMLSDQQSCLEAGMDDYVPKPIDPVLLARVIAARVSSPA